MKFRPHEDIVFLNAFMTLLTFQHDNNPEYAGVEHDINYHIGEESDGNYFVIRFDRMIRRPASIEILPSLEVWYSTVEEVIVVKVMDDTLIQDEWIYVFADIAKATQRVLDYFNMIEVGP